MDVALAPIEAPPTPSLLTSVGTTPTLAWDALSDALGARTVRRARVLNTHSTQHLWVGLVDDAADIAGLTAADAFLVRPNDPPLEIAFRGKLLVAVFASGAATTFSGLISDVLVP